MRKRRFLELTDSSSSRECLLVSTHPIRSIKPDLYLGGNSPVANSVEGAPSALSNAPPVPYAMLIVYRSTWASEPYCKSRQVTVRG